MKEISITARFAFAATAMTIFLGACAVAPPSASNKDIAAFTHRRLVKFRDMSEFEEYRDQVHRAAKARRVRWSQLSSGAPSALLAQNDSDPCDPSEKECDALQEIAVTGFRASSSSSITNNQEKDVDEGDIVKLYDRFLIVLQDGRLFSLDTGLQPGALRVVDR